MVGSAGLAATAGAAVVAWQIWFAPATAPEHLEYLPANTALQVAADRSGPPASARAGGRRGSLRFFQ